MTKNVGRDAPGTPPEEEIVGRDAPGAPPEEETAGNDAPGAPNDEPPSQKELETLKQQLEEENDRYLRVLAEYDNFKKRTAREKDELYLASKCEVLKKFLPVFDNLELAVKHSDKEQFEEGVRLIIKQLFETLTALGAEEVPALGESFDPELHDAVLHDEEEGAPENTVTEVFQKGYRVGEKVIRHAAVKVTN